MWARLFGDASTVWTRLFVILAILLAFVGVFFRWDCRELGSSPVMICHNRWTGKVVLKEATVIRDYRGYRTPEEQAMDNPLLAILGLTAVSLVALLAVRSLRSPGRLKRAGGSSRGSRGEG